MPGWVSCGLEGLWGGWRATCGAGNVADISPWALSLSHSQFPMLVLGDRAGAKQRENAPIPSLGALMCVVPPLIYESGWTLHLSPCSEAAGACTASAPLEHPSGLALPHTGAQE